MTLAGFAGPSRPSLEGLAPSKVLYAGGPSIFVGDAELAFRKGGSGKETRGLAAASMSEHAKDDRNAG
jgi:hypothetical protein